MDSALTIGVLAAAFVSSLVAIGWKTWRENETVRWSKRITLSGWISIGCIAVTLALGIWKLVREQQEIAESEAVFEIADKNIHWAVKLGGQGTYENSRCRGGKSPWEAVLVAQGHNPTVVELVKAYGPVRTDRYIKKIGDVRCPA